MISYRILNERAVTYLRKILFVHFDFFIYLYKCKQISY